MDAQQQFVETCNQEIKIQSSDNKLTDLSRAWIDRAQELHYSYHFRWMGRPIIQYPPDIIAIQELIWRVKPDLIIETGIAHGGSLIFSASMLALLDLGEAISDNATINPGQSNRKVLGIDIDIRTHNRQAIEAHPMASRIQMIEGSSISTEVIEKVRSIATNYSRVLVCLDSNHTHDHVLTELQAYAKLTSVGSYCIAFDTVVDDMPSELFHDRPWGPGNNPKTAVREFLESNRNFEIDTEIQDKLQITVAPDGYLKRVF